jgi:hypothetical protein
MLSDRSAAERSVGDGGGVRIAASCWSCESALYKTVPWRHRHHQHFAWSCVTCSVDWTGPGSVVDG